MPHVLLSAVLSGFVGVLVLVALVGVALLVILLGVLVIHSEFLLKLTGGYSAEIVCPDFQDLSVGLNRILTNSPAKMAAAIPPEQAFSPPVKIPMKPSFWIASFTPFARL